MDGLGRAIGDGIGGFWRNAGAAVGGAVDSAWSGAQSVLPMPWLPIVIVAIFLFFAWILVRR